MMAMETEITKDGVHYKELKGTPEEEAKLKESYAHLWKLRDEVIGMGVLQMCIRDSCIAAYHYNHYPYIPEYDVRLHSIFLHL